MISNMDSLPWVVETYKRDLEIERYFIGYLLHPYLSLYTGRGCPAQCTFCLWPQTIGGHKYRVRSPENVAGEMARAKPAARPRDRQETGAAGVDVVLQQPGEFGL
jgi:radical SAM superfamily enzyme YgiQ (UPF0313 family)